jgi:hypothetical protein
VNIYYVAAIWLGMALLATVVSIRAAVPAALVEIVVGAVAGNIPGIREHVVQTDVITFLASAGSLVLTFLAKRHSERKTCRSSTGLRALTASPRSAPSGAHPAVALERGMGQRHDGRPGGLHLLRHHLDLALRE